MKENMTIKKLSNYYWLTKEINQLNEMIKSLQETIVGATKSSGMPHSGGTGNPTQQAVEKKLKLEKKLIKTKENLIIEALMIEEFINTIDESEIRIIIRKRFIECLQWDEIGEDMNLDRSTAYYKVKKYLGGIENVETKIN